MSIHLQGSHLEPMTEDSCKGSNRKGRYKGRYNEKI